MNKTLVEMLRHCARVKADSNASWGRKGPQWAVETEIEWQAANRIEKLEAALRPFAEASDKIHSGYDDGIAAGDHPTWRVPVVDLRTARAALNGE